MELPKITRFLWFYLTLLLAFSHVLTAQVETDKQEGQLVPKTPLAPDSLQIELNRNLYEKDKSILYASHLQFDEKPDISDSQLYKIATDAFKEMQDRAKAYPRAIARSVPNVMTTLFIGNELIFASSAKGWRELFEEGDDVVGDLKACSDANGGKPHKNNGRCGEVNTFHEWYKSHVSSERLGKDSGAKIVAISMPKNPDGTREPQIMAPCGDDDNWGCNKFINGMYTLDNDKVAADLRKDAFAYKKLIDEKKLKPAPTRPAHSATNPVPAAPKKQSSDASDSGSKPGPPVNHLAPANHVPAPAGQQNSKPGGSGGPPVNHLAPNPVPAAPKKQNSDAGGSKPGPPVNHLAPTNPVPAAPKKQNSDAGGSKPGPPVNHLAPANHVPAPAGQQNSKPGGSGGPPVNHLAPGNRVPPNPSRPNAQPGGGNPKPNNNRPVNNGRPAISRPPSGGAGGPKGH